MCVIPSSIASRSTATAASRSAGGPNTCGPANCIAPYPMRVTVRFSAMVNVPPGSVLAAMRIPLLVFVIANPRASRRCGRPATASARDDFTLRQAARNRQSPADPGSGRDRQTTTCAVSLIDVSESNMLGDYLRARRELVQPGSVGLPVNGVRRVAGLRREEVAMLAGISSDYYLRLEQGRDRNPSIQVLEALARVLDLDQAPTS